MAVRSSLAIKAMKILIFLEYHRPTKVLQTQVRIIQDGKILATFFRSKIGGRSILEIALYTNKYGTPTQG